VIDRTTSEPSATQRIERPVKPDAVRSGPPLRRGALCRGRWTCPNTVVPLDRLRNHRFVLVADAGGISAVRYAATRRGVDVSKLRSATIRPGNRRLIYLATTDRTAHPSCPAHSRCASCSRSGVSRLLVATAAGGRFGLAPTDCARRRRDSLCRRGLARTRAKPWGRTARCSRTRSRSRSKRRSRGDAAHLLDELLDPRWSNRSWLEVTRVRPAD